MMKKMLLVGGGGHCKSVIDSILSAENVFEHVGIIDTAQKVGTEVSGINVLGTDDEIEKFYQKGYRYAFVTLGSIGNPQRRIRLYGKLKNIGFIIPNIVDSSAIVAKNVHLGEGVFIGKRAVVNAGTAIGTGTIINTGSIIEHDCTIGEFVHAAPGSVICGGGKIGNGVHVGANATIIQGITVGGNSMIGAGSVIIHNIAENCKIVGNPGKETIMK